MDCAEETVIEIKDGSSNTIEQQFVGSNKGGNCAGIYQSGLDGDGTNITFSDVDIYSAASTSYGVKTYYAKISVTSSNVIINCMTGSLKSESASNISVTNCNLIEAKITSGGALVSSPNINSISSYVYIRLIKSGTVIENNYALVYDSGNGINENALEGIDTNILKLNNANVTVTLTE